MKTEEEIKQRIKTTQEVREKITSIIISEQYIANNTMPFNNYIDDIERCDREISLLEWILNN